ncbi:MAG: hypothetical protein RR055_06110 [Oscillospiraceae bacterium]
MNLYIACILTVFLETAFLALCGLRNRAFLAVCVCANTATNLSLNLLLGAMAGTVNITYFVYLSEAAVIAAEYIVYALVEGRSKRLFLLTLAANALSYGAGLIIYGHV